MIDRINHFYTKREKEGCFKIRSPFLAYNLGFKDGMEAVEKTCLTCKHESLDKDEYPCSECNFSERWEPKE